MRVLLLHVLLFSLCDKVLASIIVNDFVMPKTVKEAEKYFMPTQNEIERMLANSAPDYWGARVRKAKSIRIVAFGGSNTNYGLYLQYLSVKIKEFCQKSPLMKDSIIPSYVDNNGMGGQGGPSIGFYDFETHDIETWPNIILLDFSINCPNNPWRCALRVDNFIRFINSRYDEHKLPHPYVMLLELIRVQEFYTDNWPNKVKLEVIPYNQSNLLTSVNPNLVTSPTITRLENLRESDTFNGGSAAGSYLMALAKFYGYPVISLREALFPVMNRFYTVFSNDVQFPFLQDGIHVNDLGAELIAQAAMKLLEQQMNPKETDAALINRESVHDMDIRMFPSELYEKTNILLASWTTWGGNVPKPKQLSNIIDWSVTDSSWHLDSLRTHENDHLHECYGSREENAVLVMNVNLTEYFQLETKQGGKLRAIDFSVSYLVSWDSTYIGNMQCYVVGTYANWTYAGLGIPGKTNLMGNMAGGEAVKHSFPTSKLVGNIDSRSDYARLTCNIIDKNHFHCITGLTLTKQHETYIGRHKY